MNAQTITEYGSRLIIIFMILPIHEFAHAWSAYKLGDNTAMYKGRLTMNPLAHIDPIGAICLLFTGYGWAKPVPINPLKFKHYRRDIALTAMAGPLSNLIVAFVGTIGLQTVVAMNDSYEIRDGIIYYIVGTNDTPAYYAILLLYFVVVVNIGLAVFNLIPVPPLDGSRILSYFTPAKYDKFLVQNQMIISIVFLALVVTGVLSIPLGFLRDLIFDLYLFLTGWVPKLVG